MAEKKSAARTSAEAAVVAAKKARTGAGELSPEQIQANQGKLTDLRAQRSERQGEGFETFLQRKFGTAGRKTVGEDERKRAQFAQSKVAGQAQFQAQEDILSGKASNKNIVTRLEAGGFGGNEKEKEILSGVKFGQQILGEEGLGRLQEDVDVQENLARFKEFSEKGLSSQEVEAERTQAFQGIDRANQGALRGIQARLAAAGVKGATAGQQLLQGALQGAGQKAGIERDLFLKSASAKREGLKDFSERLGNVKSFDLAQAAREKDIVLQAGLGQAQLGSAERIASEQTRAAEASAKARAGAAPSCFVGETPIEMADGSYKEIKDLECGDESSTGTIMGVSKHLRNSKVYSYNTILVTGGHYVFHTNGEWMKVEDTESLEAIVADKFVYNLWTNSGTVKIKGQLFADYEGFASADIIDKITLEEMNEITNGTVFRGKVCK